MRDHSVTDLHDAVGGLCASRERQRGRSRYCQSELALLIEHRNASSGYV
jgi:hypothetical protein